MIYIFNNVNYMYRNGKIYIMLCTWCKIDNTDDALSFMYYPAIYTLMKILPLIYKNTEIILRARGENYDLVEGDTLIWLGIYNPDFSELKNKNIYTTWGNFSICNSDI